MTSFKLFALGSNGSGQLGIGHKDDTAIPQLCKFDESFENIGNEDKIVKIVAGGNHTLILFESGLVFAAGNNEQGQCCLAPDVTQTTVFRRANAGSLNNRGLASEEVRIVDISATWEASFLLGDDGRISVFGAGAKGELGVGEDVVTTSDVEGRNMQLDVFFDRGSKTKSLSSGMRHSIVIGPEGEVYGWGSCRKGELGPGLMDRKVIWKPEKLSVPFECQRAIVGRNFTGLFGNGACTVFGDSHGVNSIAKLKNVSPDNIASGWSTAYALIEKRVQAFGRNDRGQWSSNDLPDLKKLAAGSEHCLGLTTNSRVVAWGWGEHGNCGEPTDARGIVSGRWNAITVSLEDNEEVVNVAAGCATSFIVVEKKPS